MPEKLGKQRHGQAVGEHNEALQDLAVQWYGAKTIEDYKDVLPKAVDRAHETGVVAEAHPVARNDDAPTRSFVERVNEQGESKGHGA